MSSPAEHGIGKNVFAYKMQALIIGGVLGGLGGLCVDAQDHVFILNRQDVVEGDLNGANLAPMIIEFDPAGNVVNSWGDPKLLDQRLHSCHFDKEGNIWFGVLRKDGHTFAWYREAMFDLDSRLRDMDRQGVDMRILSLSTPNVYEWHGARQVEAARHINDVTAAMVRKHPDRFAALGSQIGRAHV